ncbi:metal-sensitive transcriptional regulator [Candidatus Woesebacteria bacterium]|nr:metal-sensitive transcriptional regulator [Candidatus Woesebacteria bacterium]
MASITLESRLNRIIGQLKGIQAMLHTDREVSEIIQQLLSVKKALDSTTHQLIVEKAGLQNEKSTNDHHLVQMLQKVIKL